VLDVELSGPVPDLSGPGEDGALPRGPWLLVRLCGEALGWQVVAVPGSALAETLCKRWTDAVGKRLECDPGFSSAAVLAAARASGGTPFAHARASIEEDFSPELLAANRRGMLAGRAALSPSASRTAIGRGGRLVSDVRGAGSPLAAARLPAFGRRPA
jgi:hypothetical protein